MLDSVTILKIIKSIIERVLSGKTPTTAIKEVAFDNKMTVEEVRKIWDSKSRYGYEDI